MTCLCIEGVAPLATQLMSIVLTYSYIRINGVYGATQAYKKSAILSG